MCLAKFAMGSYSLNHVGMSTAATNNYWDSFRAGGCWEDPGGNLFEIVLTKGKCKKLS